MPKLNSPPHLLLNTFDLLLDALRLIGLSLQPNWALVAENLFLRKQLALYLERKVKPRRASDATRLLLIRLFQQAAISSVRACHARPFQRMCASFNVSLLPKRRASTTWPPAAGL